MNKLNNLTLGSLFDGIGGFPYAASFFGIEALWASEILPEGIAVTKRHFPNMRHVGDITALRGGTLPPVDIITFGSPCQGLSIAGRRLGLADERSGLFSEAIRIIREMQEVTNGRYPQIAIWENVPGALSSDGGRDFRAVLEAFTTAKIPMPPSGRWTNAGMVRSSGVDLAWCVYDAQYFGTAQRRRRVFLVADFTGQRAGQILFVPKSLCGYFAAGGTPRQGAAAYAQSCVGTSNAGINESADRLSPTLADADGGGGCNPTGFVILNDQGGNNLSVEKSGLSPTLRSETHGNLPVVAAFIGGASPQARSIGYSNHVTPTLRNASGSTIPCIAVGINGDFAGPISASYARGTGERSGKERDVVLCAATGQSNAEIMENLSPTLNCGCEQPYIAHPQVAGTLCGSGAGLSRPAGMSSELDLCVVATAVDCRNLRENGDVSGTLQAKEHGYSLNYQNPVRMGCKVRRLTPLECERLQGYPDGWTEKTYDGKPISDTKRYQMLGNSVAVPCVAYIMQGVRDAFMEPQPEEDR